MVAQRSQNGLVQIVQEMSPGGIETMTLDLAHIMGGAILCLSGNAAAQRAAWPALAASTAPYEAFDQAHVNPARLLARLAMRLRQIKPRAVVLHHVGPLLHGGLAARAAGVEAIVHIEHDAWHYGNRKHRIIAKLCERLVRPRRIAVSDAVAAGVRKFLPGADLTVIPPGIETDRFVLRDRTAAKAALGLAPATPVIGTVGRLAEVKGHKHLIAALALLSPAVHCLIVGDGAERASLEADAVRLGVAGRVTFLGLRSDPEAIIPAMDVFCLPSLAEGLPRAVLEAQSCGVPVAASAVGGVPTALAPGGRLVQPADLEALAGAVRQMLADPPDAAATRQLVIEKFSLAATVRAIEAVIARP